MKSELAQKLQEVLDSMTQEQFDQEWAAVTALNLEGPSFDEIIEYLTVIQGQTGTYELITSFESDWEMVVNNYNLAA